ncbi:MAG: hypothetical protein LBC41_08550 [Clostridiales bacterium]|jgi:tetratricopeptide (TPR) repeat protein|nr:hypothetical protein [Clostridiales bacterium]
MAYQSGSYEKALDCANKALQHVSATPSSDREAAFYIDAMVLKGNSAAGLGRHGDSISAFDKAIKLEEKRADSDLLRFPTMCLNMATSLKKTGNINKALVYVGKANIDSLKEDSESAYLMTRAASIYWVSKSQRKARTYMEKAKAILDVCEAPTPDNLIATCRMLGDYLTDVDKEYKYALRVFEDGWVAAEKYGLKKCEGLEHVILATFAAGAAKRDSGSQRGPEQFKWLRRVVMSSSIIIDAGNITMELASSYIGSIFELFQHTFSIDECATIKRITRCAKIFEGDPNPLPTAKARYEAAHLMVQDCNWPSPDDPACRRTYRFLKKSVRGLKETLFDDSAFYGAGRGYLGNYHLLDESFVEAAADFQEAIFITTDLFGEESKQTKHFKELLHKALHRIEEE